MLKQKGMPSGSTVDIPPDVVVLMSGDNGEVDDVGKAGDVVELGSTEVLLKVVVRGAVCGANVVKGVKVPGG